MSTGLFTAVVQSGLVGALVYCLARAYFEDDAARKNGEVGL